MYTDQDYIHTPDDNPNWQEGFVMIIRDLDTDLVGFMRLGTYVNQKDSQLHFGLALPDGTRFRRHIFNIPFDDSTMITTTLHLRNINSFILSHFLSQRRSKYSFT